jgi:hypothetical protein
MFGPGQVVNANAKRLPWTFDFPVFEFQWLVNIDVYATLWYYLMLVFGPLSTGFHRMRVHHT